MSSSSSPIDYLILLIRNEIAEDGSSRKQHRGITTKTILRTKFTVELLWSTPAIRPNLSLPTGPARALALHCCQTKRRQLAEGEADMPRAFVPPEQIPDVGARQPRRRGIFERGEDRISNGAAETVAENIANRVGAVIPNR